ncbi:MAG: FMN-binding protein [Gammaproteobacteria bacterium]|nr:FMN-binding protein [Gammaproteobacteria bacterium]MBU1654793.1 FMN-binding protein [Gammaproteobacteria bacterium]MBU1961444.1 FMN-binding protein [Gammaproteobacteria bacterium]
MSDNQTKEPGSATLILSMVLAGLISGVAIIGVFEATLPTITLNKAKELREAVFKVLPGVSKMQKLRFANGRLQVVEDNKVGEDVIYAGYDAEGKFIGYAVPSEGPGFQDTISLLYGYLPDQRKMVGMEILDSRETPGLGDKIFKDLEFVANFKDLSVDPTIVAVKKGKKAKPNEIDAITGATISSKAVVRIMNVARERWEKRLPPPGNEPELKL